MSRRILLILPVLLLVSVRADAWPPYNNYFPTPDGDYLPAVGATALNLAIANRINSQTSIMENEYSRYLLKSMMADNIEYRRAMLARNSADYVKHLDRVRNQPGIADVKNAGTLNLLLQDLINPLVPDSVTKYARVPLEPGILRRIPFQLGKRAERFSLARLTPNRWAVAFQAREFAPYRKTYKRAVQDAMLQATNGAMQPEAIRAVQNAVGDLERTLEQNPELFHGMNQRLYSEAKTQLGELGATARLLQTVDMQVIFAEIDFSPCSTVHDLRVFMRNHELTFAGAKTDDEIETLTQINTAIRVHLDMLKDAQAGAPAGK